MAGLLDRRGPVRPGRLSPEQLAEFDRMVKEGPDVATDGVVRWRRADLKVVVERRFGVILAERTIGDLLHARGLRHISVRPRHPRCDEAAQESFKQTSPRLAVGGARIRPILGSSRHQVGPTFHPRPPSPYACHPFAVTASVSSSLMYPRRGCMSVVSIDRTIPSRRGRSAS